MTKFIEATGDLLKADVDALTNTVNTVGVMGKGIALEFKSAFPQNFNAYREACEHQRVRPGTMFIFENQESDVSEQLALPVGGSQGVSTAPGNGLAMRPRWIINFPTKRHWRARSRIQDVATGLDDLRRVISTKGIKSIAVPALGCGHGGLEWDRVRPLIKKKLEGLDVDVHLYAP